MAVGSESTKTSINHVADLSVSDIVDIEDLEQNATLDVGVSGVTPLSINTGADRADVVDDACVGAV